MNKPQTLTGPNTIWCKRIAYIRNTKNLTNTFYVEKVRLPNDQEL